MKAPGNAGASTFTERYQSRAKIEIAPDPLINLFARYEALRGVATSSNYRRFQVRVVIKLTGIPH